MANTKEGGKQAARTNKAKYGKNFYKIIGAKGGQASRTGGFYQNKELARHAGTIGGMISRRGGKKYDLTTNDKKVELARSRLYRYMDSYENNNSKIARRK